MKINIDIIRHEQHRYETAGDWWLDEEGVLQVRVSQMEDSRYTALVALHEVVEVLVESIARQGELKVRPSLVALTDAFDKRYEESRAEGDDYSEPGYDPDCPVYQGHMIASAVEHLAAMLMNVNYNHYQAAIFDL